MALAEQAIESMEDRLKTILRTLGWGGVTALSILLAVTGWGLNKTWEGQSHQTEILRDLQHVTTKLANPGTP